MKDETRYDVVCVESPNTPGKKVWHSFLTIEKARKKLVYLKSRYEDQWQFAIYVATTHREPVDVARAPRDTRSAE